MTSVWLIWDGYDYYGPHIVGDDVYATEAAAQAAMEKYIATATRDIRGFLYLEEREVMT